MPGCDSWGQLSRVRADDVPEQHRELAVTLRARLLRAFTLQILGRNPEAAAEAQFVQERAHQAKLAGFEAEALYRRGRAFAEQGKEAEVLPNLERSFYLAVVAGTDVQALVSGAGLVQRMALHKGRLVEAKIYAATCEALWNRLGSPEAFDAEITIIRSSIAKAEGRLEELPIMFERNLASARRLYGERSLLMVRALGNLAWAHHRVGHVVEGNRFFAQTIHLLLELKGPDEPILVLRYQQLGFGLAQEGRRKEALEVLERGLTLANTLDSKIVFGPYLMMRFSQVLEGLDEPRALALAEEAVRRHENGTNTLEFAECLYARARALTALGRPSEALKDCQRAQRLLAASADSEGTLRRYAAQCEAEALMASDPKAAAQAWERALEVKPAGVMPHIRATLAFGLARALRLSNGDAQRARELANQALEEYAPFPGFADRREVIEKWLTAAPR